MEILKIKNLTFNYPKQDKKAIDDISLSIKEGEFVVVCGESGCGKTTLLKLIKRELAPAGELQGEIFYKGRGIQELEERTAAGEIGFVMQNPDNQLVTDKVWHELAFGLENLGLPNAVIKRRVAEMASFFGIGEMFRKDTALLSGGQKQLLNLASVMAMSPKLLLLDEPTSQLDPIAASEFIGTLAKINKELGTTIVLVEHRLEEVFPLADRVLVMERDKILVFDTPQQVGSKLRRNGSTHRMLLGLPSALRIFSGINLEDTCPITVREGRSFLKKHFGEAAIPAEQRNTSKGRLQTQQEEEAIIEVTNLWFRYERELPDILEGISFKVHKGQLISILGGNGSGKSTLLKVIASIEKPYKGSIRIKGRKLKDFKKNSLFKGVLALLPQNPQSVFIRDTVREDYQEIFRVMGYTSEQGEKELDKVASVLNIEELLDRHPYDLSGGEQQKAAIGKLLLLKPELILLDEPTKGMDAYSKENLKDILRTLTDQGVSIIMVTHDVEFAAEASEGCAMLFDGSLSELENPRAFFSGNQFYTTAANRIARDISPEAITCEEVVEMLKALKKEEV